MEAPVFNKRSERNIFYFRIKLIQRLFTCEIRTTCSYEIKAGRGRAQRPVHFVAKKSSFSRNVRKNKTIPFHRRDSQLHTSFDITFFANDKIYHCFKRNPSKRSKSRKQLRRIKRRCVHTAVYTKRTVLSSLVNTAIQIKIATVGI